MFQTADITMYPRKIAAKQTINYTHGTIFVRCRNHKWAEIGFFTIIIHWAVAQTLPDTLLGIVQTWRLQDQSLSRIVQSSHLPWLPERGIQIPPDVPAYFLCCFLKIPDWVGCEDLIGVCWNTVHDSVSCQHPIIPCPTSVVWFEWGSYFRVRPEKYGGQ